MLTRWKHHNPDGSLKYDFDGITPIEIPNDPTKPVLRDLGLTVVHPFYGEKDRFDRIMEAWKKYSDEIKRAVTLSLVDDCGSPAVMDWLPRSTLKRLDLNIQVHKITENLKWNTPGALNLGVHTAPTDWVLMMDSDCIMPDIMLKRLLFEFSPDQRHAYFFMRHRITDDPVKALNIRPLTCSILIHKERFAEVGGFDEDFTGSRSGGYGCFDAEFHDRIKNWRQCVVDIIIDEYIGIGVQDLEGVKYDHYSTNRRLFRAKQLGKVPRNPERLRFAWKKEFSGERW